MKTARECHQVATISTRHLALWASQCMRGTPDIIDNKWLQEALLHKKHPTFTDIAIHWDQVNSNSTTYLQGFAFKSQPGTTYSNRFLMAFLSSSMQILGYYFKSGYDNILSSQSFHDSMLYSPSTWRNHYICHQVINIQIWHFSELFQDKNQSCIYSVIQGFCRKVDENCVLLGYYAASSGNSLLTFQDNLSVLSSRVKNSKRKLVTLVQGLHRKECGQL